MNIVGGYFLGVLGVAWLLVVMLVCILGDQLVLGVACGGSFVRIVARIEFIMGSVVFLM